MFSGIIMVLAFTTFRSEQFHIPLQILTEIQTMSYIAHTNYKIHLVNTNTHQLSVNTNIYYTVHCIEVRKYGQLEYQLGQHCHSDTVR